MKIEMEEIRGAVARGWCHDKNSAKVMDSDLALAISDEVNKLFVEHTRNSEEALTKIGNYCAAHDDVIDASWVAKVIDEARR